MCMCLVSPCLVYGADGAEGPVFELEEAAGVVGKKHRQHQSRRHQSEWLAKLKAVGPRLLQDANLHSFAKPQRNDFPWTVPLQSNSLPWLAAFKRLRTSRMIYCILP